MEKIILGLLMYRGMTAYELKRVILRNFDTMCSNSSGSLHTALRKLLDKELICHQSTDNKKIYFITEAGRSEFTEWLGKPMDHTKSKNMELSKIYFLGIKPSEERVHLINSYLSNLEMEKEKLIAIQTYSKQNYEGLMAQAKTIMDTDAWNQEGIKKISDGRTISEITYDIYSYQMEILQYGLDSINFEIDWYQKLLERTHKQNNL